MDPKCVKFSKVKVFSVSSRRRETIDDEITKWLRSTNAEVVECHVRQSSDREFHCLSLVFFIK